MARIMAVNGQPVRDQLALLDNTLEKLPADRKSSDYAYIMRDWSKTDANAYNYYMSDLRSRDKALADAVEERIKSLQRK